MELGIIAYIGFLLLLLIIWFWSLIDVLKSDFQGSGKVIWLLLLIFIPPLGVLLYFFIGRKQKVK